MADLQEPSDAARAVDAAPAAPPTAAAGGPDAVARLQGAAKSYGDVPALGPLDLAIPRGCVGLLGPNGAGKSTLLRLLVGTLPPTSGTVTVLGEEVRPGNLGFRRRIGYMPEGPALFPALTGVEAVAFAGRLAGMDKGDAMQRAHQVLDYVGLDESRYRVAEGYSTGMRQRLKLAQALVHGPELLILDEPTEGVDPEARRGLLDLIGELSREHGLSLILSTHLLHDVEQLASHAIVLRSGQVVAQGSLAELTAAPQAGFVVRGDADPEPLARGLRKAGLEATVMDGALRVATRDPAAILRAARDAGVTVRHLAPLQLSLTEAFEQAVGGATHA